MILRTIQAVLVVIISVLSAMLLRHQYVTHFPIGPYGNCIAFYSQKVGGKLITGVIESDDIPGGKTSVRVIVPRSLSRYGVIEFENAEIRSHGYVLARCQDEKNR